MKSFLITLNNNDINVIINQKKIKNIYFRIDEDLNLSINVNKWISQNEIISLIKNNKEAILKMYDKAKQVKDVKENYYLYLGNKYKVIINEEISDVKIFNDYLITPNLEKLNKFTIKKCKEIFKERIYNIKQMYNSLPDFSLKVRKMKTRWGVCNYTKKTITLNSELIAKDVTLIDYVIIHELCHFKYQDHSKNFWNEVSKYYPYYKNARKMLTNV